MNLLIMTFQGDIAGSTYSISYLAKGLANRGHQVYVGARKESLLFTLLQDSKVNLVAMTFHSKWDKENMMQIRDTVRKYDIQLINAQSSRDRYSSIFARWRYGLKYKLVHTRRQVSLSMGGPMNLFYQWGTDRFVAVSQGVKDSLVKKGMRPNHIKVIPNGTPPEKYEAIEKTQIARLEKKFVLSDDDFVIGCISRKKDQIQLLKALRYVDRPVKLILVGVEEGHTEYEEIIQGYQQGHKIFFEGTVPPQKTLAYYRILDLKVLTSTTEGLSQSLLEAMFLEVPVLATAAAGNLDLIKDGINGIHFQHEDISGLAKHINAFIHGVYNVTLLKKNALKEAREKYAIDTTISRYEDFFEALIGERAV